jgi:4-amino-4-deoxy-L-arabinose transferase-like glycosyltransferase
MFIAIFYSIFGRTIWIVLIAQVFISAVTVLVVYGIVRQLTPLLSAKYIAAILYSICLLSAYYSTKLLTETLFTFLFSCVFLVLIIAFKKGTPINFMLAAVLLGLATLVRPISLYYPIVIGATLMFQKERFCVRVRNFGLFLIIFLAIISTWQMRNYRAYGYYSLTNQPGDDMWRMQASILKASIDDISQKQAQDELIGNALAGVENPFERANISKKIGIDYIKMHMRQWARQNINSTLHRILGTGSKNIYDSLFGGNDVSRAQESAKEVERHIQRYGHEDMKYVILNIYLRIIIIIELLFAMIACVILIVKKQMMYFVFFGCTLIYFIATPGLMVTARYKVPIMPMLIVLSAVGISYIIQMVRGKQLSGG